VIWLIRRYLTPCTKWFVRTVVLICLSQVIETERGQQLADEYNIKFMETSAKNSINVDQAFINLAQDIKKRLIDSDNGGAGPAPGKGDVTLDGGKNGGKPDGGKDCGC